MKGSKRRGAKEYVRRREDKGKEEKAEREKWTSHAILERLRKRRRKSGWVKVF